jgi:hypothetical protein
MKSKSAKPPVKSPINPDASPSGAAAIQRRALVAAVSLMGLSVGAADAQQANPGPQQATTTGNQLKSDSNSVPSSSKQYKLDSNQHKGVSSQYKLNSNQLKVPSGQKPNSNQSKALSPGTLKQPATSAQQ